MMRSRRPAAVLATVVFCGAALALVALAAWSSGHVVRAADAASPAPGRDGFAWNLPPWLSPPPVPPDNPMSQVKVELGRRLFHDVRLSGVGFMSCASCHDPLRAYSDGLAVGAGAFGDLLPFNTPSLANVGYRRRLGWADPEPMSLERQAERPLFSRTPIEMGGLGQEASILARLGSDPAYAALFRESFPEAGGAIRFDDVVRALGAFQRTLISAGAPFDRYRFGGEFEALSASAKRGMSLFESTRTGCASCHGGPHFDGSAIADGSAHRDGEVGAGVYHNTGVQDGSGGKARSGGTRGLMDRTGSEADRGKFRTPSLRNLRFTAPYMHDGSLATLEDVIAHYEAAGAEAAGAEDSGEGRSGEGRSGNPTRHGAANPPRSPRLRSFRLTAAERADLIAFLDSLNDEAFLARAREGDPRRR